MTDIGNPEFKDRRKDRRKDRLRDRSDIGEVRFPIETLMEFRHAEASCVHIEAALEANRRLTNVPNRRRKRGI